MQRRQEISRALAVVLLLIGSLLVATPAKAKTNTVILYGSEWLGGGGVDIYSNDGNYGSAIGDYFKIPVNGVEYRTGLRWQCVEMVYRLYLARGWISLPTNPNTFSWSVPHSAREMYDTAPSHLNKSPNGAIEAIGPGDVVVLNGGSFLDDLGVPAGHVAIVESVSGSTVTTVNQNLNGTNARRTFTWNQSAKTLNSGWAGYGTIGIVHAPGSTSNRSQPFIGTPADGNVVENITPGAGGHYYVAAGGVLF
ncbi:MAG TPA: CHAP domain-containing protein, partial [Candidatus Saccharimonadales bacterium]|nr:CHAP domain-containing protein [Candidatus Saccharimonadales bacterium]